MKASEIINHILNLPKFFELKEQSITTKALKLILGKSKEKLIRYGYIKDECLYICVSTPFALQELKHDSSTNSIKNFLNMYFSSHAELKPGFSKIKSVRLFVAKQKEAKIIVEKSSPKLKEQAKGNFEIKCQDSELKELFEQIKKTVRKKNLEF